MKTKLTYLLAVVTAFSIGFAVVAQVNINKSPRFDVGGETYIYSGILTTKYKGDVYLTRQIKSAKLQDGSTVRIVEDPITKDIHREVFDYADNMIVVTNDTSKKFVRKINNRPVPLQFKRESCESVSGGTKCDAPTIMPELGIEVQHFVQYGPAPKCQACPPGSQKRVDMWVAPRMNYMTVKKIISVGSVVLTRLDPVSVKFGENLEHLKKYDGHTEVSDHREILLDSRIANGLEKESVK